MLHTLSIALVALLSPLQDVQDRPRYDAPLALRGATVVVAPGKQLENATVLVEDGRITSVGDPTAAVPPGTREIDATGMFVYAGFVDGLTRVGIVDPGRNPADERRTEDTFESTSEGPRVGMDPANRNGIFARRRAEDLIDKQNDTYSKARDAGFAAAMVACPDAILGGSTAVISLGDAPLRRSLLVPSPGQTASFNPPSPRSLAARDRYPSTTFGVMAQFRQFLYDAQWLAATRAWSQRHPQRAVAAPLDRDIEAIEPVLKKAQPLFWSADDFEEINRALDLAKEFGFRIVIVGGRDAWRIADRLKATDTPVILTLSLPKKPAEFKLDAATLAREADDPSLFGKNWQRRPFEPAAAYAAAAAHRERLVKNAMALEKAGVRWCISTDGLGRPVDAFDTWREWVEAGLSVDSLVAALTTRPAELLGAAGELGSVEKGRRANLVVLSGPIEAKNSAVKYTIVDGRVFEPGEMSGGGGRRGRGGPGGPGGGRRGGGAPPTEEAAPDAPKEEAATSEPASAPATASAPTTRETPNDPSIDALAHTPAWPIETAADREPGFRTGGSVLLKNATVLTISGEDLASTSVLVTNGKITGIGRDLKAGPGVREIDLTGYVVMPGIFDPHSHIALDSVNEMSLSVVPEVRCADVVRSNDTDIYYALAGGVTGIHAMHGSANTIGGQCVLLKLKWGRPAAEMLIKDGPRTVKFATGENVTRSGRTGSARGPRGGEERARRFPGSRMGVEAVMRRSLLAGQEYAQQRAAMAKQNVPGTDPQPLRRDIRLEALADIVEGHIWVNCHCYRADEILRLLDVAEDFGIRIGALHHCLEAYRIMPEIVRHGAGTATFSDWWAYKIEAFDAVPQNAGMLLRAGVNSTLKSDSADLMRRMPLEAAKAMKVSALTSREALAMITLNAAKEFGLDSRFGSIEVGKDADLAVFDGHPLDTFSRCVLTFVEGEVYFRHREFNVDEPGKPKQTPVEFRNDAIAKAGKSLGDGSKSLNRLGSSAALPDGANAIVIENATIHPVNGPAIERGSLVVKDGKIAAVGATVTPPAGSKTVNGEGMHVWPGMINAAATVGLSEVGSIPETIDTGETGMYVPDVAALSALNPHSATVGVTRAAGITTLLLTPSGSRIAGQASLVQLKGWTASEMDLNANLALVLNLPQRGVDPILDTKPPSDREQAFEEMRSRERADERAIRDMKSLEDFLYEAQRYNARREAKVIADTEIDARFEAMRPYVSGARPVLIGASSYKSILEVVVFADRFKIRPVILGGRDAWKAADLLAARRIPVIYDATFDLPRGVPSVPEAGEAWDANFRAAAVMEKAGVKFCFASRDASLAKNLSHAAGFSIAHGLSEEAAVRALTLAPAEILGIADAAGSLEVGKRADLVVTDGHIARATTQVEFVMIGGEFVSTESKHTQDAERFSRRGDAELPPERTDLKGSKSQSHRPER